MKFILFVLFFSITIITDCLKMSTQFKNPNYNFGKFVQVLHSESKLFF